MKKGKQKKKKRQKLRERKKKIEITKKVKLELRKKMASRKRKGKRVTFFFIFISFFLSFVYIFSFFSFLSVDFFLGYIVYDTFQKMKSKTFSIFNPLFRKLKLILKNIEKFSNMQFYSKKIENNLRKKDKDSKFSLLILMNDTEYVFCF